MRSTHEIVQDSNQRPVDDLNYELDAALADLDETDLLSLARRGHDAAFGTLFDRYRYPAERFARHLGLGAEAPDVVSESFAQMFDLLSRGKGPEHAFRAYMFTTIRHEAGRRAKARWRVVPTDETDDLDTAVPFGDGRLDAFEQEMVREAYQALPERWRSVLWALDVEGRNPRDVASIHGMSANAVSALAYRARSGLRESYLRQHINGDLDRDESACTTSRENIAAVVRGTAKQRVRERLFQHLESCAQCDAAFDDLTEVNGEIGRVSASAAVAVTAAGAATWHSGLLSGLTAIKAQLAAAIVPVMAVGAVALVPAIASGPGTAHDPPLAASAKPICDSIRASAAG
ncbi:MAG: sigma-70 family RNA polymerase sigma factor [Pseudolysinimonas sp.]